MQLSRRELCAAGVGTALIPLAWPANATEASFYNYNSTLVSGLTPSPYFWAGRKWRPNMGSTWYPNMDYSFRVTQNRARFELRKTSHDHAQNEESTKYRTEISGSLYGDPTRLPNGVPLWGAMSFIHHHWDDPVGMAALYGGVHGQIHIGSTFGGSPAVAFRRHKSGELQITTRGELDSSGSGTVRYRGACAFDQVHDLVYVVVLHPTNGSLTVWLDRKKIVDVKGVSIGTHYAESYWNVGCYYSGGVTCPVIAEYANHVYPASTSLSSRTTTTPLWPRA